MYFNNNGREEITGKMRGKIKSKTTYGFSSSGNIKTLTLEHIKITNCMVVKQSNNISYR